MKIEVCPQCMRAEPGVLILPSGERQCSRCRVKVRTIPAVRLQDFPIPSRGDCQWESAQLAVAAKKLATSADDLTLISDRDDAIAYSTLAATHAT